MSYPKRTFIPLGALLVAAFAVGAESVGATGHAGDFNGDGADDVLLRHLHSDAWRYYTLVDDVPVAHELAIPADPAWRFVATGDFDGNGYDDVLLRNVDTLASVYYAVTATGTEKRAISLTKNPLYDFLGTGDFDGDGKDEILIRRREDYGVWFYYDVEGTRATLRRDSGATQNLAWDFAGIGDFNGDGRDDILIRHSEFLNWIYYEMNGTAARAVLRRPGITRNPLFTFHAVADITGDGRDDVMLRNTKSREWIYYAMTGPQALLQRPPGMTRNPRWTLHAIGDFDGSGRATPLIRLSVSGGWALYDIQGLEAQVVHFPAMSREQTWAAVGTLPSFHEGNPTEIALIEFMQGPPVFRKDFRTGETIGPITGTRPENGADPLEPQQWRMENRWREENRGFVTAVWKRRMVIAVTADHTYAFPTPAMTVRSVSEEGGTTGLETLYDVTDPIVGGPGYRTEMVFDLPRELNLPGTSLEVVVRTPSGEATEALPLFGETVEEIIMRWIPISTETVPAVDYLAGEGDARVINAYMPVGDHQSSVTEDMRYQLTGNEAEGAEFHERDAWTQLKMHQTTHGCGPGELYVGVYNYWGMENAGVLPESSVQLGGDGVLLVVGWEVAQVTDYSSSYGHEFAHAKGLIHHVDCPAYPQQNSVVTYPYEYPYPDGMLGPARSWHHLAGHFMERGVSTTNGYLVDEPRDIMSYCTLRFVSDFTYQQVLTYMQAPFFKERMEGTRACLAEREASAGVHRSLAILGKVDDDGGVTILDMRVSDQPPWPSPTADSAPSGAKIWTIELLDGGGGVVHSQGVVVPLPRRVDQADAAARQHRVDNIWSYRIPYSTDADTVLVRDSSGDLRGSAAVACPRCGNLEAR